MNIDYHSFEVAYRCAFQAYQNGEVPVGAALICEDQLITSSPNRILELKDPTAHAEMLVLREAARILGNERLTGCDLYVTLEPCMMCSGAIVLSRLRSVHFLARDEKQPALRSLLQLPGLNHLPRFREHRELPFRSAALLSRFFRERRKKKIE